MLTIPDTPRGLRPGLVCSAAEMRVQVCRAVPEDESGITFFMGVWGVTMSGSADRSSRLIEVSCVLAPGGRIVAEGPAFVPDEIPDQGAAGGKDLRQEVMDA